MNIKEQLDKIISEVKQVEPTIPENMIALIYTVVMLILNDLKSGDEDNQIGGK